MFCLWAERITLAWSLHTIIPHVIEIWLVGSKWLWLIFRMGFVWFILNFFNIRFPGVYSPNFGTFYHLAIGLNTLVQGSALILSSIMNNSKQISGVSFALVYYSPQRVLIYRFTAVLSCFIFFLRFWTIIILF